MELYKEYLQIKTDNMTKEEEYLNRNKKSHILMLNPIFISSFIIAILLYQYFNFSQEESKVIGSILSYILNFIAIFSLIMYTIKRISFMNKTNFNLKEDENMKSTGKLNRKWGKTALSILNFTLLKGVFAYYLLGYILAVAIYLKTGMEAVIGLLIVADDMLVWRISILLVVIICISLFLEFRRYIFKEYLEIIMDDLIKGDIEVARKSIRKTLRQRYMWGENNIVAFREIDSMINKLDVKGREVDVKTKERLELITNASHDIKTPLTSIISYSKILQRKDLKEEERKEYLKILKMKALGMKKLMDELKEASEENVILNIQEINLEELIRNSFENNKEKFIEKDITINFKSNCSNSYVKVDKNKTERIFQNIISNIYKYARENSEVNIEINNLDNCKSISIENLMKDRLELGEEELTKRFVRGDKSRNTEGNGLGLSIVKRFMEIQKGSLSIKIKDNKFKVILKFYN